MDDLRRRFADLDQVRAPDLWDAIELRAAAHVSIERVGAVHAPVPVPSRGSGGRWILVLVATGAMIVALVAGAFAVGSGLVDLPASVPVDVSPSPSVRSVPSASVVDWTGPLRPDPDTMPLVLMEPDATDGGAVWTDGPDAQVAWIDIEAVRATDFRRLEWRLELGGVPPRASTVDPTRQVIKYGVVLDAGGDGVADCLIGISDDAPEPGDFRVWVTNLATGATSEQVGPPYGFPIDFSHPLEQTGNRPSMIFFFLSGADPCELSSRPVRFYAWASMSESGRVTAWDYAPDAAWLEAPDPLAQP
jgi:hypothetical protein